MIGFNCPRLRRDAPGRVHHHEFWSFYADVRAATFGDDPDELLTRAFALADRLALDPGRRRLRESSSGMRRKAQLITGVMSQPRLLMVDEPQNGLDFISSHEVRVIIAELREAGATIVMSNHDLDSVARMADHVIVVRDGSLSVAVRHRSATVPSANGS